LHADGILEDETRVSPEPDGAPSAAIGGEDADVTESRGPVEQPHLRTGFHTRGSFFLSC